MAKFHIHKCKFSAEKNPKHLLHLKMKWSIILTQYCPRRNKKLLEFYKHCLLLK